FRSLCFIFLSSTVYLSIFRFFLHCYLPNLYLHSFPTRRSSDLITECIQGSGRMRRLHCEYFRLPTQVRARRSIVNDIPNEQLPKIGRAHVLTPVTVRSRMPSSA